MIAYEVQREYAYKIKDFKKFIESENARFYNEKNIELIGGDYGKWLEFHLPDHIIDEDFNDESISQKLFMDQSYV